MGPWRSPEKTHMGAVYFWTHFAGYPCITESSSQIYTIHQIIENQRVLFAGEDFENHFYNSNVRDFCIHYICIGKSMDNYRLIIVGLTMKC